MGLHKIGWCEAPEAGYDECPMIGIKCEECPYYETDEVYREDERDAEHKYLRMEIVNE